MENISGINYISPEEDFCEKDRFGKDVDGLEEYDLVEVRTRHRLAGHYQKRFVRLDSHYFSRYINEVVNNPDSSYETFLDKNEIRDGVIPKNFSVLIKHDTNYFAQANNGENEVLNAVLAELCVPAIMNELKISTVYNSILVESDGYSQYIFSIDAIKPGETLFNLEEFLSCDFTGWIGTSLAVVKEYARFLLKAECHLSPDELESPQYIKMIDDLQNEFIIRYLANVLVVGNIDFNAKNCGFLVNRETKQVRFFPCFDYELCFNKCYFVDIIEENIREIMRINPNILEEFSNRLSLLVKADSNDNTRLGEVLIDVLSQMGERKHYEDIVIRNAEDFFEIYDKVLCEEKSKANQVRFF